MPLMHRMCDMYNMSLRKGPTLSVWNYDQCAVKSLKSNGIYFECLNEISQ